MQQPSPSSDYQRHIEQALKNVLRKVKNPGLPEEPKTPLLHSGRITSAVPSGTAGGARVIPTPPAVTSPVKALPAATDENVTYLEAEDLYTPIPLLAPQEEQEAPVEVPLVAEGYKRPFNIFEEFVETELNILLSRYIDLCRCPQCRADIVALSLQQLPSYYITGTRGTLTAQSMIAARYMQKIMDAVTKAIHVVYKRPRPNCQKIVQVLWVKPQLEEFANETAEPQYFRDSLPASLEMQFSQEVAEIIGIMDEERHHSEGNELPTPSDMHLLEGWD